MSAARYLQGHKQLKEQRRIANATEQLVKEQRKNNYTPRSLEEALVQLLNAGIITTDEFNKFKEKVHS